MLGLRLGLWGWVRVKLNRVPVRVGFEVRVKLTVCVPRCDLYLEVCVSVSSQRWSVSTDKLSVRIAIMVRFEAAYKKSASKRRALIGVWVRARVLVRVKQGLFEMLYLARTVSPSSFVSMFHVTFLQYSTPNMR